MPADYSRGGICSGVNTDGTAMTSEQVKAQSDALFNQQMGEANTAARSLLANVPGATADRIMVVTDLFYNQGSLTNMPLTRDAIQAGKWDEAANQLLYANGTLASGPTLYATQVGVRATRDAIILRTGSSDNLK